MTSPGWLKPKDAANYAGISERTFREWLKRGDLRFSRLPTGMILIRKYWLDAYLTSFEVQSTGAEVDKLVENICRR